MIERIGTRLAATAIDARRRGAACATLLVATALLAGCMNLIPAYERPAAPIAASFDAEASQPAGTAAADIEWRRYFTDARLKRLIDIALQSNRDLRLAMLNIEQAQATYQLRRADTWPTLGVGANASRQVSGSGQVGTSYAVGFAVTSYEVDLFGRVRSLSQSAQAQVMAAVETRNTVQISLVSALASTYLNLQADDALLELTRQTLATREESFKLAKLRFDNGVASELDLRQAESLLEGARAALAQLQRQRRLDENALVLLVGQPLPAELPAGQPMAGLAQSPELPAGLPSELLERRPDVRAAEQQLIAANANIGAARAAFFPRISLTGNAGSASAQLSGLFKGGTFALTGTAQLLQTLFDAGRNQGNLELAQVQRKIAVAQYEKAIQSAFREVADALAGRETLVVQLRAQTAAAQASEATARLSDLRYRNGAASYLEVLDAHRALYAARQAVVQLQTLQAQNQLALYKVLGGGWNDGPMVR
ncbi:MAG: efflux transporter outer membrane subunit [Rhizobacter sp.]|nr:efflux transporter outer membrane subunit [Rhizobacter sp.]